MPKKIGNGGYVYPAKEFLDTPDEPIEWNIQSMVHSKGKTLIIGLTKTGKTIFAIILALSMVTGQSVFSFPIEKCRVLYIVLERYRDFKRKLRDMAQGMNLDNLHVLDYSKKPLFIDTLDTKGYDTLKEAIAYVKPDIVILDAKYRTTSKKEVDEQATSRWINNIDSLIENEGVGFVIIHHSPKHEYEELVNKAAGSSILSRWADVIIGVKRVNTKERKDPRRLLEFVSNYGYEPDPITVKITDKGMEDVSGQVQQNKLYEAYQILEEDLKKNPGTRMTKRIYDLADKHLISARTFWAARELL